MLGAVYMSTAVWVLVRCLNLTWVVVDTALVVSTLPKLDELVAVWLAWVDGVQAIHVALGGWKLLIQIPRPGHAPGCADNLLHIKPNIALC